MECDINSEYFEPLSGYTCSAITASLVTSPARDEWGTRFWNGELRASETVSLIVWRAH